MQNLRNYFEFSRYQTSFAQEARGALTTFLSVIYILIVVPKMLGGRLPEGGSADIMTFLAITMAIGTMMLGIFANLPFALGPGMALTAYVSTQQDTPMAFLLGHIFVASLLFLFLNLSGILEKLLKAIPSDLKRTTSAGIGLFLAMIGAKQSQLIVPSPFTISQLGDPSQPPFWITSVVLLITTALLVANRKGAFLVGIILATILALTFDKVSWNGQIMAFPEIHKPFLFNISIPELSDTAAILTVLLILSLDSVGTFKALQGFREFQHHEERKAFGVVALCSTLASCLSLPGAATYLESASGVSEGAKTGFSSCLVATLCLLSLFFWPLLEAIPAYATSPVLMIVGTMMMGSLQQIQWGRMDHAIPAFLTLFFIPFSFSIATGLLIGWGSYGFLLLVKKATSSQ